jgi:hypothetical protein
MNSNYIISSKLLTEQNISPEEQQRIHQAAIEREKNWAKGGAAAPAVLGGIGTVGGSVVAGGLGAIGGIIGGAGVLGTAISASLLVIPYLIIAAVGVALSSGIAAGISWLVARMTRRGYEKQQIEKAVQVLKQRVEEKQDQQSQQ